ncbi:MAG: branched-chain amino acid ABC transporter permease [Actinomycetota bacterium]|nr:branched-chain amino acid ABC transporter permease [Actinomycetota bacterium]
MTDFLQQVVAGLASGGIYASLALAIVLIYRTTRVVNFAQGEMAMFTTFVAWTLMDRGLQFWPAFALTLAIAFVGGVAIERVVIRPVEGAPILTVVIVTIGLALLLNGLASALWGSEVKSFRSAFSTRAIDVGGVAVSVQDVGVIAVSLALVVVLGLFFRYTKLGLALRAAAVNPDESRLVGIRVGWMLALGWGLAAVLGAVAGMLVAPTVFLEPNMMRAILLYAFAAAVLGGMDSPVGAVVGGLAFGVIQNLVETYVEAVGATLRLPVALALLLVVLLVRPQGLFGRAAVGRV